MPLNLWISENMEKDMNNNSKIMLNYLWWFVVNNISFLEKQFYEYLLEIKCSSAYALTWSTFVKQDIASKKKTIQKQNDLLLS